MSHFPNIVDQEAVRKHPPGSRRNRRKVRIVIESAAILKSRLDVLAMELGMTAAEIGRYALWDAVLEAEVNKERFCQKVAREKLKHVEQERLR